METNVRRWKKGRIATRLAKLLYILLLASISSIGFMPTCIDAQTLHQEDVDGTAVCTSSRFPDSSVSEYFPTAADLVKSIALDSGVTAVAWSPNGQKIATSEKDDTIVRLWDVGTGQNLHTVYKQNTGSRHLLFTKDGRYIITSSSKSFDGHDRTAITVIDVDSGQIARQVEGPYDPSQFARANAPADFVLSPDGRVLFVTFHTKDSAIREYDTTTWSDIGSFKAPALVMQAGPKIDQLTIGQADGFIRIWNVSTRRFVYNLKAIDSSYPSAIALQPEYCLLATGAANATLRHFDQNQNRMVESGSIPPLRMWHFNQEKPLGSALASAPISSLYFATKDMLLVATTADRNVVLFKAPDLRKSLVIHVFDVYALDAVFSPDNSILAAAGDQSVLLFKLR